MEQSHTHTHTQKRMSTGRRRPSSRQSTGNVRISDDEILLLVSRLNQLLPRSRRPSASKGAASKVLEETCEYVRNLQREVGDLSERLSLLLSTVDPDSPQAAVIRALI